MKILHLADLHIGKKVNGFSMLDEQKFVLAQALEIIKNHKIEAILICGDVFDRPVPSIDALELFNDFLNSLNDLKTKVFIISGNHDSADRLAYLSSLLKKSNVFVSNNFNGTIEKYELDSQINIYLIPYLYPALVKKHYPEKEILNYSDAIKCVVDDINLDENKINILLAHQFVVGTEKLVLSDSETKSVGGIDEVSYSVFEKFDYTALGHLHCPQRCGSNKVYYAGSILKYSFSEINQNKKFCILDVDSKNDIKTNFIPINFLHEMKQYRGKIDEFLSNEFICKVDCDDYIHFILEDDEVIDAKKKLSLIYPNIMLLEFDNQYTRSNTSLNCANISCNKTMYEHFCDFYKIQMGQDLDGEKNAIVQKIINSKGDY